jgi:hypothetical protein
MQLLCTALRSECIRKSARRKLVKFTMLRLPSPPRLRRAAHVSNTSVRFLTFVLGSFVLLSSAIADRDHRPPAGARAAIELIADRLTTSRSKTAKNQPVSEKQDVLFERPHGLFWQADVIRLIPSGKRRMFSPPSSNLISRMNVLVDPPRRYKEL